MFQVQDVYYGNQILNVRFIYFYVNHVSPLHWDKEQECMLLLQKPLLMVLQDNLTWRGYICMNMCVYVCEYYIWVFKRAWL